MRCLNIGTLFAFTKLTIIIYNVPVLHKKMVKTAGNFRCRLSNADCFATFADFDLLD